MRHKKLLLALFLISLVGYASSFFMEPIIGDRSDEQSNLSGYTAFYYGLLSAPNVLGIFRSGFHSNMLISVVWLANVAYWIGVFLFLLGKNRGALVFAECGFFLAYPPLGIWIWGMWLEEMSLVSLSYGFFVWFGSIILLALASRLRLYFGSSIIRRPNVPVREPALV